LQEGRLQGRRGQVEGECKSPEVVMHNTTVQQVVFLGRGQVEGEKGSMINLKRAASGLPDKRAGGR